MTLADVVRDEGGRILAVLAASTGDLQLAEDATQDAMVAAMEVWDRMGVPANPTGWLYVAARRKALDVLRRESSRSWREGAAQTHLAFLTPDPPTPSAIRDDQLRLIFTCCHPALALDAQVALALRTLCGLSTAEVARGLLVTEPTMAKRLGRTKQKIAAAGIPYRIPDEHELGPRVAGVCSVIHQMFTAGHHGSAEVVRVDLCDEAVRLGRLVAELLPRRPELEGLLALLLLTDARRPGRFGADGSLIPLAEQDRSLWRIAEIREGAGLLDASLRRTNGVADPYQLQAAIAACHSTALCATDTDWVEVNRLYDILRRVHPNPIVELNAAVAAAEVDGPAASLERLERLDRRVGGSLWWAARGEMLFRLDRWSDAASALDRAAAESVAPAERAYFINRSRDARDAEHRPT